MSTIVDQFPNSKRVVYRIRALTSPPHIRYYPAALLITPLRVFLAASRSDAGPSLEA